MKKGTKVKIKETGKIGYIVDYYPESNMVNVDIGTEVITVVTEAVTIINMAVKVFKAIKSLIKSIKGLFKKKK